MCCKFTFRGGRRSVFQIAGILGVKPSRLHHAIKKNRRAGLPKTDAVALAVQQIETQLTKP